MAWQLIRNRATRVIAAGSLALTGFLSSVLVVVGGGRLAYNSRESTAQWLDWASRLTSLGEGMPVWYRDREAGVRRRRRRVGGRACAGVVVRATNRGRREIP